MFVGGRERVQGVERWMESKDWVPARVKSILKRISEAGETFVTRSDDVAKGTYAGGGDVNRPKRVIIIGDSLVVGIGCKEAPVMPVALCRQLASLLKVDVQWRALGVDGGDVRTIHRCGAGLEAIWGWLGGMCFLGLVSVSENVLLFVCLFVCLFVSCFVALFLCAFF